MNKIKKLRKEKKLTLDDLAKLTGIKRGTLNNYENNKTEPKLATWKQLANFFNVSVPYIQGLGLQEKDKENIVSNLLYHYYDENITFTDFAGATVNFQKTFDFGIKMANEDIESLRAAPDDSDQRTKEFNKLIFPYLKKIVAQIESSLNEEFFFDDYTYNGDIVESAVSVADNVIVNEEIERVEKLFPKEIREISNLASTIYATYYLYIMQNENIKKDGSLPDAEKQSIQSNIDSMRKNLDSLEKKI